MRKFGGVGKHKLSNSVPAESNSTPHPLTTRAFSSMWAIGYLLLLGIFSFLAFVTPFAMLFPHLFGPLSALSWVPLLLPAPLMQMSARFPLLLASHTHVGGDHCSPVHPL